jgi:hypothetical protein
MTGLRAVLFVGSIFDPGSRSDIEVLPPARQGDVEALLGRDHPPAAIGLVDGVLPPEPAVSAKELLHSLDRGIPVFGAAGIGALRAVECDRYGMAGVGRIYQMYRSDAIDADDEVLHTPDSEPLVNMRFAVAAAVSAGAATPQTAHRFLDIAKELYYPQRTVASVLRVLAGEVGPDECAALHRFLTTEAPNTARDDAIALVATMEAHLAGREASS